MRNSLLRYFSKIILTYIAALGATTTAAETSIHADVWADNWFQLYIDEQLVAEDSVPFATERSFNAESFVFNATLPAQAAIVMKDYYEDDSGLEYIGHFRQQMGDGGLAAQFRENTSGDLIGVSNSDWVCLSIHHAPLNKECARSAEPSTACQSNILEEPLGWKSASFDDGHWQPAVEHSARAVRPHGGYDDIDWAPSVQLIWGEDLEIDNALLCRFTLNHS